MNKSLLNREDKLMVAIKNTIHYCLLLLLAALPLISQASERLDIRKTVIDLSDRKLTDQLSLDVTLSNPDNFEITISSPGYDGGSDKGYFYLRPVNSKKAKNRQVKVALDLPYESLTPGGPYQTDTENSVKRDQPRKATHHYSSCRAYRSTTSDSRVCKPLSFIVIDEDSVPGQTYETRLTVKIKTAANAVLTKTIHVIYTNTRSSIGIYSAKDGLILKPESFSDNAEFCVFSQSKSRFDVQLEGKHHRRRFYLEDQSQRRLFYRTKVTLNRSSSHDNVRPYRWISGGIPVRAKNVQGCYTHSNLTVEAYLTPADVSAATPGHYTGTLTVRVRAK